MTDDQIINSLVKFALKVHHPAPIPVGDILLGKYDCDHRQKDIILIQIEHYKLMELLDKDSGSLMRFTEDGLKVATSDNPIEAINKLRADKNKPLIDQSVKITGDMNNSPMVYGPVFGNLESNHNSIILEPPIAKQQPIVTSNIKANLSMWDKFVKFSDHKLFSVIILALLATIYGIIKTKMGWKF